jgi:signal transduction histidine kinase/CheY-like chemotaxis protein
MKALPDRTQSDSVLSNLDEHLAPGPGRSARAKQTSLILMKSREVQRFAESLEVAEQEARCANESWRSDSLDRVPIPDISNSQTPSGIIRHPSEKAIDGVGQIQYQHDTRSLDEEIVSNVKEVQRFNKQLEAAEREANSLNDGWGAVDREEKIFNMDPAKVLELITSVVEVVREPLIILDNDLRVQKANRAFYRTFDQSEDETETRSIYDLARGSWNLPALRTLLEKALLNNRAYEEVEIEFESPPSARKTLRLNVRRISGGEMILMSIRDVTPRRRTEVELDRVRDELRQGQKMEVVGRLAGGVAHDFNNILTGILGFSELILSATTEGTNVFHHAFEIKRASERAAALTQQLLAFSRRQVLRRQVVNLNTVFLGLTEMLRRLIGDHIELKSALDEGLGFVHADPGQMSQVILNIALNARDAMPEGGSLYVRTENTYVSEKGEGNRGLAPGRYISLAIIDSGIGMDDETQQHIFEPFYTTKPQGSGTGLGLATVFGIVEQSDGKIHFVSSLGSGTTFWIDFPRVEGNIPVVVPEEHPQMAIGTETVLLVEDDDMVRELVGLVLEAHGYTVLQVRQPNQALALCQSHPSQIDLMLTDLLMPGGMDGRQLAERASEIRREMKILLMSGYTTDALVLYGVDQGAPFLHKPFSPQQLTGKIREVLDKTSRTVTDNQPQASSCVTND